MAAHPLLYILYLFAVKGILWQKALWCHPELCSYCAGMNGKLYVDEELRVEWKSLLSVCKFCMDEDALPLVRSKRRNGSPQCEEESTIRMHQ